MVLRSFQYRKNYKVLLLSHILLEQMMKSFHQIKIKWECLGLFTRMTKTFREFTYDKDSFLTLIYILHLA